MTVVTRDARIEVREGLAGRADLRIDEDRDTFLGFLAGKKSLVWALFRRKTRLQGFPR